MKKILAILISLLLVVTAFTGCGEEAETSSDASQTATTSYVSSTEDETEDETSSEDVEDEDEESSKESSSKKTSSKKTSSKKTSSKKTSSKSTSSKKTSSNKVSGSDDEDDDSELNLTEKEKIYYGVDETMYDLSVVNKGNSARIASLMKKAEKGGNYTIAVLGGSISQGAGATSKSCCYGSLVNDWWSENFPEANFTFVNAGIGSTNPEMACYRIENDLLKYNPDFVVVDFTVNTYLDNDLYTTYSTLLYKILSQKNSPAVMSIHFTSCDRNYYNAGVYKKGNDYPCDDIENAIKKYDIPTVSYHKYIWNKIDGRILKWYEIGSDYIHPNDNGHLIASNLIGVYLKSIKDGLSSASTTITAPSAPDSTGYLSLGYVTADTSGVISCSGMIETKGTGLTFSRWTNVVGEDSELKVNVSTGKSVKLFVSFSGNEGEIVVSGNGKTKTIPSSSAATPTLVSVGSDFGSTITVTSDANCGSYTIFGVGYTK